MKEQKNCSKRKKQNLKTKTSVAKKTNKQNNYTKPWVRKTKHRERWSIVGLLLPTLVHEVVSGIVVDKSYGRRKERGNANVAHSYTTFKLLTK